MLLLCSGVVGQPVAVLIMAGVVPGVLIAAVLVSMIVLAVCIVKSRRGGKDSSGVVVAEKGDKIEATNNCECI